MRIRNTKICYYRCDYNELDDLADFLERKAREGWELTSKTGTFLGFKRREKRKVKICVEVVLKHAEDEALAQYEELCMAAGWKRVFSDGSIQIYENVDPDADPVSTDPLTKLAAVHYKCRNQSIGLLSVAVFTLYIWYRLFVSVWDYTDFLSALSLLGFCFFPVMAAAALIYAAGYFLWYRKAKKTAETGSSPSYRKTWISRICSGFIMSFSVFGIWGALLLDSWYVKNRISLIATGILIAGAIIYMIGFDFIDAQHNRERRGHLVFYIFLTIPVVIFLSGVTGVLYDSRSEYIHEDGEAVQVFNDEMPVDMEDIGIKTTDYASRYLECSGSPFLQRTYGEDQSVNAEGYRLVYTLFQTENSRIYQRILKERYPGLSGCEEISDGGFTAEHVYLQKGKHDLLLLYEDAVLELNTNIPLTAEQKKIIEERLLER